MHEIIKPINLKFAVEKLIAGELVAFPTETVYGLGGNAFENSVVEKIFAYKNRPKKNPLPICYKDFETAACDVFICESAKKLAEKFLPGPLTLLLKRKPDSKISEIACAELETICVRIPSHPIAQKILSMIDFPLAVPSANKSTKISPTSAQLVSENLYEINDLTIIDGGQCNIGIESTIVDLTGEQPKILRQGAISEQEIFEKCGMRFEKISSPAFKHYVMQKKIVANATKAEKNDALLAFGKPFDNCCRHFLNLSESGDLNEAAANFFSMLQELDKTDAEKICIMSIPNMEIGISINDRIKKAIENN